jgi:hypothetical protein
MGNLIDRRAAMRTEALEVAFGEVTETTVDVHVEITTRIEIVEEAATDWVLEVRVQGLGHRYHTFPNGTRYQVPHNKTHGFVIATVQRPAGLAVDDLWRTRWTATLDKHDVIVEDNDQYLFWVRLMPHVQINPTREFFASIRQDID